MHLSGDGAPRLPELQGQGYGRKGHVEAGVFFVSHVAHA